MSSINTNITHLLTYAQRSYPKEIEIMLATILTMARKFIQQRHLEGKKVETSVGLLVNIKMDYEEI